MDWSGIEDKKKKEAVGGVQVRVVIVGARTRSEMLDTRLVNEIIDDCIARYGKLMIVTKSCDKGVGKIVKHRCIDSKTQIVLLEMMEVHLRHYILKGKELPKTEFTQDFNALNATLVEIGDEFHLLTEEEPVGAMQDLLERVAEEHRPFAVYKPSENRGGPKHPELPVPSQTTTERETLQPE